MELKRVIEILENHQQWRRDNNVPPKTEMQSPIEIGAAIDYAISKLKKLLLADVSNNGVTVCDCKWVKGCNLCGIGRIRIEDCIDYVKQTDC